MIAALAPDQGRLTSSGPSVSDAFRQRRHTLAAFLNGEKPSDLPEGSGFR